MAYRRTIGVVAGCVCTGLRWKRRREHAQRSAQRLPPPLPPLPPLGRDFRRNNKYAMRTVDRTPLDVDKVSGRKGAAASACKQASFEGGVTKCLTWYWGCAPAVADGGVDAANAR